MAKIFGGSASRLEVYALFAAAVVLIGGGVAGAVVVTSNDSKPAEVAQESVDATVVDITVVDTAGAPTAPTVAAPGATSPSISGLTDSESQVVRDLIDRETEAQRLVRLQKERQEFASSNPVARYDNTEILSCTDLPMYDRNNPSILIATFTLVKYRVTYEAFQQMSFQSYINPGLGPYQVSESDVRHLIDSGGGATPDIRPLELSPGRHSVVMYGLHDPNEQADYIQIEVRLRPADSIYGHLDVDLRRNGPFCR
jgi:hypothetical protein